MKREGSLKEIVLGSGTTFVGVALASLLQYVLFVFVSRTWGARDLGLFVIGLTIMNLGGGIFRLGLSQGALRFGSLLKGQGRAAGVRPLFRDIARVTLLGSLVGTAVLLGAAGLLGELTSKPGLVPVLRVLALGLPLWNLLLIAIATIQAQRRMNWMVSVRDVAQPVLALVAVPAAALLGAGLVGGTVAYVVSLVPALAYAFYVLHKILGPGVERRSPFPLRAVLGFSLPLVGTQLVAFGVRQQEVLLVAYFLSSTDVGFYGAALKTAFLVNFVLQATNAIFAPLLADLHGAGDLATLRHLYRTVSRWCFTLAFPVFLFFVLFGEQLLALWGRGFAGAWTVLVLLGAAQLVNVSTGSAGSVLIMGSKQKIELVNTVFGFAFGFALDVLLIPRLGLIGAALAAFASITTMNLLRVAQVQRLWGASPFSVRYLKPLAVGSVAAIVVYGVDRWLVPDALPPALRTLAGVVLLAGIYGAGLGIAGVEREDRETFHSLRAQVRRRRTRGEVPPAGTEKAVLVEAAGVNPYP